MKRVIALIALCYSIRLFADGGGEMPLDPKLDITKVPHVNYSRSLIPYVQLAPELSQYMPGVGFGLRSESETKAVDVCFSYSSRYKRHGDNPLVAYHPKLLYLTYVEPEKPKSFFYGPAGAWGTLENKNGTFSGLLGGCSVGYETGRDTTIRQITSLEVMMPVIPFYQSRHYIYLPVASITYSLGF